LRRDRQGVRRRPTLDAESIHRAHDVGVDRMFVVLRFRQRLREIDAIREGQACQQLAVELPDAGDVGYLGDARLVVLGVVVAPRFRLPLLDGPYRDDTAVEVVADDVLRGMAVPAYLDPVLR